MGHCLTRLTILAKLSSPSKHQCTPVDCVSMKYYYSPHIIDTYGPTCHWYKGGISSKHQSTEVPFSNFSQNSRARASPHFLVLLHQGIYLSQKQTHRSHPTCTTPAPDPTPPYPLLSFMTETKHNPCLNPIDKDRRLSFPINLPLLPQSARRVGYNNVLASTTHKLLTSSSWVNCIFSLRIFQGLLNPQWSVSKLAKQLS